MEKAVVIAEERKSIKESLKETILALKSMYPQLEKVSDEEILKALLYCKKAKLDPFKREVHFIPYGKSLQVVTSYTEYIKRGEKSGKLDGWTVKVEGETKNDLRATVIIYRKDWSRPFEWTVYFREVAKNSPTWEAMPVFMLKKAAISQAFRLAFPEETGFLPGEEAEIGTIEEAGIVVEPESIEQAEQVKEAEKVEKASLPPREQDKPGEAAKEEEKKEPEKVIPDEISKESREKLEKQINQGQINIIVKELTKTLGLKEDDPVFEVVKNLNYEQAVEILKKIREKKHKEVYEELLKLAKTKGSETKKEEADEIEDIEDLFEYEEDEEIPF